MKPSRQIACLLVLSFCGALASQLVRTNPLAWYESWSTRVEREALAAGLKLLPLSEIQSMVSTFTHVFLDARPEEEYLAGRIPGAMNLPTHAFDEVAPQILPILLPDQPVVVYCSGVDCDDSIQLGTLLIQQGYTNIYMYPGGFTEWEESGQEVER